MGFKKAPNNDKAIDEFAQGASIHMNPKKIKEAEAGSEKLDSFFTKLQPSAKELIQAVSYHDRISQREVIEQALSLLLESNPERAKKAVKAFRNDKKKKPYSSTDFSDILDD